MNVTTALALSRAGACFGTSSMRAGHLARRVNSMRGTDVNGGAQPTSFAWTRGRNGWDDKPNNPGHCRLLTHGEFNTSRWLHTYHQASLVIDPQFVADVVEDGLPADRIAFVTRHSVADSVIADYATTFRAQLAADSPKGALYAETLTVG